MWHYFTLSLVSDKDCVVRHAFPYELCKGRYLLVRSVLFLNYPYLMVGIKISRVISVSIFFRLLPHFFVDPGGPFQRLYSGHWSELGSTKDKGIPPSFSSFSYFYSFVLRFPRISRLHCGQSLGSRALTSNGVTKTRNPYPSLAPPYRRRLWVKIHPSLIWPNCVLDTQIISKRAVYIIMLISGYTCPQVNLLQIIREGVRVDSFVRHFKGNFKGKR